MLRGALDGLATVAPVGDPDWVRLRGDKALDARRHDAGAAARHVLRAQSGDAEPAPALPGAAQATIVHAVATPYRERSHFDGQDVLESGLTKPGRGRHRLAQSRARRAAAGRPRQRRAQAFAVGPVTPLVVRGRAPVLSWTPPRLPPASDDTVMRLLDLYRHTDPALARVLEERIGLAADRARRRHGHEPHKPARAAAGAGAACAPISPKPPARRRNSWRAPTARASARWPSTAGIRTPMKARPTAASPRCSARSTARSRRSRPAWARRGSETVVAVVTEFGRTARINGTDGTDHGTATVALLAGGALKGGRVIADWPGLKRGQPLPGPRPQADDRPARRAQGRAARSPARRRARARRPVFPGSARLKPASGLVIAV